MSGVRGCFKDWADPDWLREVVELLNPLLRKLESIFTGDGGRKDFGFSPSLRTRMDLRIFEWNEVKGAVRAGLLMWYCDRSKSFTVER
jgi:hypothetical protein